MGVVLAVPASYLTIWVLVYGVVFPKTLWLWLPSKAFYVVLSIWLMAGALALVAAAAWTLITFFWSIATERR